MANKLQEVALEQEFKEVDGIEYMFTAWPASYALTFISRYDESLEKGKADLELMKDVICASVSKDGKQITRASFDIMFSRKTKHIIALYEEILAYNLGDLFTQPDSEE